MEWNKAVGGWNNKVLNPSRAMWPDKGGNSGEDAWRYEELERCQSDKAQLWSASKYSSSKSSDTCWHVLKVRTKTS